MNKIWNGKLSGLLSFLIIVLKIILLKINIKINTFLFVTNINKCGRKILIMPGVIYRYPQKINFNNNIIIGRNTTFFSEIASSTGLFLQDNVSIGENCNIDFSGGLIIRKNVHLAHNVLISTHDHGYDYRNSPVGKSLDICENVFIGSHSIIMHNVSIIGANSVIGSGAVVTKDVPPNCIIAGNPAKIIKYI